ncbi:MAG: M1 family metallopeptidase [Chloroflexi bacterium]|nr:M1 family metallopeptidase [Chloroflexota bacterium]MBU1747554.1 M1 family metallopeptidase [Chloroflexota bacterium]
MPKVRVVLLALTMLLSACNTPGPTPVPSAIPPTQTAVIVTPTPSPTPVPTPTPVPPTPTPYPPGAFVPTAARYVFHIDVDYENHTLEARETVIFTNTLGVPLADLGFYVPPNHEPGTLFLEALTVTVGSQTTRVYDLQADDLHVPFQSPLQPGQTATVEMAFTVEPPRMRTTSIFGGGGLGWSENAMNAGNWYPVLRPYRAGEGWYAFDWHSVGDPYVTDWADYEATITAPEGVTVVANGDLTRQGNAWTYRIRGRSLAFAASHRYQSEAAPAGAVTIESYWFPEHEPLGRLVLTETARCLLLDTDLFGPYPYDVLRIAETDFNGGQEFSGITFLGSGVYADYLKQTPGPRTILYTLIPHELSHQWWFGLVGNDQCREPWLDEALAQYSELFFYERFYPDDAAFRWEWMGNTVRRPGPIDGTIYDYSKERAYKDAVYLTGALFIGRLREALGDERFFAFLQDYAATYRGRLATTDDFFAMLGRHATPEETDPLRRAFFR